MKPLLTLDLESTGVNVATDRIISIGLYRAFEVEKHWLVNPGIPIPEEVQKLTGITDAMVKDAPPFKRIANEIYTAIEGFDLLGFNLTNFDVPLLWEEFYRAGLTWDISRISLIDAGTIFKRKEERTLTAAVKFFCGDDHEGAHSALADCEATERVFVAQMERYADLSRLDRANLARYSIYDEERLSLDGKIIKGPDGEAVYNFGKQKGTRVKDDTGFGYWMLGKDFPEQTKQVVRKILEQGYEQNSNQLDLSKVNSAVGTRGEAATRIKSNSGWLP